MNISVHIERLVLGGLELNRAEAERLKGGLEVELTRLLSEGQFALQVLSGGSYPNLKVDGLKNADASPEDLGRQVAGSVYGGIRKAE